MAKISSFTWQVSVAGHRWIQAEPEDGSSGAEQYLVEYNDLNAGTAETPIENATEVNMNAWPPNETEFVNDWPRKYRPLEESGLFLHFVEIDATPEGILAFANDYGLLGGSVTKKVRSALGSDRRTASGERLKDWTAEIDNMRQLIGLWRAAAVGDVELIKQYLPKTIGTGCLDPQTFEDLMLRQSMRAFTPGSLNQLKEAADLTLKTALERKMRGRLSLVFSSATRDGLIPQPDSLLGALWLQFGAAVAQAKQFRQCETCGKWFEVSPQVARTNRVFCSTACRSRAYRNRKDKAREMNTQGVAIEQIAESLQSEVAVVRGWIEKG
jgi:hypothetical protein